MSKFADNRKTVNRFSGRPSLRSTTYTVRSQFIQFLLYSEYSNAKCILDFGAGNSPYKEYFKFDIYDTADVNYNVECKSDYIIDPSNPKIPLPDNSYSLILVLDVLEHVQEFSQTLEELIRLLKPGGNLLIKIPFLYREHEKPFDFRRFTTYGLRRELNIHDLNVLDIKCLGNCWSVAYSLIMERFFDSTQPNFMWRFINKVLSITLTPILNASIFRKVSTNGIYSSILCIAQKPVN